MTHSTLATGTSWTSDRSSRNGARIDRFIVHHAATTSLSALLSLFQPGGRTVSANYAIKDGQIIATVPEEYRPWTSASAVDDARAVTVEVANSSAGGSWPVSEASFHSLARLIADVSARYGFDINDSTILTHQELYRRFGRSYATACPGDLQRRKGELINLARKYRGQGGVPAPAQGGSTPGVGRNITSRPTRDIQRLVGANPDGIYGPETTAKVKAWQKKNGLEADGIWGPLSDAKGFPKAAPKSKVPSFPRPVAPFPLPAGWYFGPKEGPRESVSGYYSYREEAKAAQRLMQERGYDFSEHGIDGLYGPEWRGNIIHFQKDKGITADGLLGIETWTKLHTEPVT